jgi:hypothetical protein
LIQWPGKIRSGCNRVSGWRWPTGLSGGVRWWGKPGQRRSACSGKPSEEGYFREWDLVYWLGPERGYMSIDSEWMVLRLGKDGKVAECRIVRD